MAFQPAFDCASAAINFVGSLKPMANVLNFKYATGYDQDAIDLLAQVVDAWAGVSYIPLIRDTITYVATSVRGLENSVDLQAVNADSTGPGTLTGGPLPNNVTFCLSLRTGLTGRSARGRFYVMPYDTTKLSGINTVSSTFRNTWIGALETLQAAAGTAGWSLVVLSRQNLNVILPLAIARTVTDIISVNDRVDSQRNRLPKE